MSLEYYRIEAYHIDKIDGDFLGAYVFEGETRNFLLSDSGYSILLDNILLKQVKEHKIDEALAVILVQHRFIKLKNYQTNGIKSYDKVHPVYFMIDLTNRCNMACKYCLREGDEYTTTKKISKSTVKKICDYILTYCRQNNEDKITIQPWGGERLLEKNTIFEIQDYLTANGINPCISIESNGVLLSDELIEELYKRNIWTSISIDGPKQIHDQQRVFRNGKPTHSIVEKNLLKLRDKYAGQISVIATLTKKSYKYVRDIIYYLVVDLKIENIKLNFVHKSSFADNENFCMTSDEIAQCTEDIFYTIMELIKKGYKVGDYNVYTKMLNLLYNKKSDVCICDGCHGGRRMITFDSKGDIFPCDLTDYPEECIGNIEDNRNLIKCIEAAMETHPYFQMKREERCNSCPWFCYCKGGCTVHIKTQGKEPPAVDNIESASNRKLYTLMVDGILNHKEEVNAFLQEEVL